MNIPTSIIIVLLAVAWLLLLVPMIARKRERVHRFPASGAGLRVLQRASGSLRTPRRRRTAGHPSSQPREEYAVTVGTGPEHQPMDAAEEWAAEQAHRRPRTAVAVDREDERPETDQYDGQDVEHDDEELRPVPRRAGRGGFDPDAAEATRAYKYQQRRRVTLVLLVATVVFALGAILASGLLWWPAGLAGVLLVAYLAYLRRQVKIEARIRARRMEKLQRARQVRPAVEIARARAEQEAALYRNRRVVDVEDDDPAFEHLEYHEAEPYRRAVGQ